MIHLPDTELAGTQVLVCGRVFDSISGRGVDRFTVTLTYTHKDGSGRLPLRLQHRADGWYALVADASLLPDFTGVGTVTLTARVDRPGRDPVGLSHDVEEAAFVRARTPAVIGGTPVVLTTVPAAPFTFSAAIAPQPVALVGVLVRDNDPSAPVAGREVAVDGGQPVETDEAGRFFVPALPVKAAVTITVANTPQVVTHPFRPDYDHRVNTVTISLPPN